MTNRSALCLAAALLVLAVLFRTFVSGWGPPADVPASTATMIGLGAYPADNLSYISWAEQARQGRWLFEILYTTTGHERLFFNPLFLLVGNVASLLAVSPLLVLNVLALFSLPVVVLCVSSMCRALGLGAGATFAAACLAIGGGGLSWLRRALGWFGVNDLLLVGQAGPDLSFYDVYPVVAYFIAPYHAFSLAFLALLAVVVVRLDDVTRRLGAGGLLALAGLALTVAAVRPHTAIMVLGASGSVTAVTLLFGQSRPLFLRRLTICACLAGAMLPPVLYSVWVAQQPVWAEYARMHPDERHEWLIGFFFLWGAGALGAGALGARRLLQSPFAFLASWAFGAGLLLLVLNGMIYPKLTYGFTMALAVLAGVAIEGYQARFHSRVAMAASVAVVAFLALASPLLMMNQFVRTRGTTVYSELFDVIRTLRADTATPFPAVLTDCGTGVLLPGLGGTRVFCGHWALTDHNRQKIVLLSRLGFLAEGEPVPSFPEIADADLEDRALQLLDQISGDTFQYLVVRKRDAIYQRLTGIEARCAMQDGTQFAVLRMCPEVKTLLEAVVASESHGRRRPFQSKS